jgi:succinoglycan biosynthesis protein ExoO
MAAADEDFVREHPNLPADARRAQAARRRSLQAALVYDGVIARLNAHDLAGGLSQSLRAPECWPLMAMPVKARLRRLAARLAPHEAHTV